MSTLVKERWDTEYLGQRYINDPPIPFVADIIQHLQVHHLTDRTGLYIGCGNGRNYLPLIDSGLNLIGLDISANALTQIEQARPKLKDHLVQADFLDYRADYKFDYIISIQIFQHGTGETVPQYFQKARELLKPGGLFFLRVNSIATDIFHSHETLEKNNDGGFTIRYLEGPKKDLAVHFYSQRELEGLTKDFHVIQPLREVVTKRQPPKTGSWVQWEGVWQKMA